MLDLTAVGRESDPVDVSWTSDDALLYALSVGAGHADPLRELSFTTENSEGVPQSVLPTFGAILVQNASLRPSIGVYDRTRALHAAQAITLYRCLPVSGRARIATTVAAIHDEGWGALVVFESSLRDASSGDLLLRSQSSTFIKDAGGFGGDPAPRDPGPTTAPDVVIDAPTRPEQALLYRLCGDRNPLHSDPASAARMGFVRPILHGLCTYGIAGRLLMHAVCDSDPARFGTMRARFSRRVVPGETLRVQVWRDPGGCRFRAVNARGHVVLDDGTVAVRAVEASHARVAYETH